MILFVYIKFVMQKIFRNGFNAEMGFENLSIKYFSHLYVSKIIIKSFDLSKFNFKIINIIVLK